MFLGQAKMYLGKAIMFFGKARFFLGVKILKLRMDLAPVPRGLP